MTTSLRARRHSRGVLARWLALAAFLSSTTTLAAEPPLSLRYELASSRVREGETVQLDVILTLRVAGKLDTLELPDIPSAFTVLQERRATQVGNVIVNGRRTQVNEQRFMYLLRAETPGTHRIPGATARLGSALARVPPLTITVMSDGHDDDAAAVDAGPQPGARFGKELPAAFLEMSADATSVVVGQQLTVTTEIYSQQPLTRWPQLPPVKPPGFFCTPLLGDDRPAAKQRQLGGRTYYVYLLNKDALFATSPGKMKIAGLEVDAVPAGSFFTRDRSISLKAPPIDVTVLPLPDAGKPARFVAGNVGQWQLAAAVQPTSVPLGQTVTLRLVATGSGSLDQLQLPTWDAGDAARVFPATRKVEPRDVAADDPRLGGRVIVEMLVQPAKAGELRIPAFTLASFDPDAGEYRESTSRPLVVSVTKGAAATSTGTGGSRQLIERGTRPLHAHVAAARGAGELPVVGGAAVLALGLGAFFLQRRRRRHAGSTAGLRASTRRARQRALADARARGDVAGLERVVMDALVERWGASVQGRATAELAPLLTAAGAPDALANDVVAFIRAAEAARYVPGAALERQRLSDTATSLVHAIEEAA